MDRDEPFTFETGDSGPKSDIGGSVGKSTAEIDGSTGRVDPAIARATAEAGNADTTPKWPLGGNTDSSGGDTPSSTSGPAGRRGRHKSDCTCEKCSAKRANTEEAGDLGAEPKTRNIRASFVTRTLMMLHTMAAAAMSAPELKLDNDDAKLLGDATAEVLKFYKVKMTAKQEAYAVLIEAAGQVYPPMFVSLYIRKMAEREQRKKTAPSPPKPTPSAFTPGVTSVGGFDPGNITIPKS